MNRKTMNILMGLALALVLISLTLVPFGGPTQAAPPAAPTPVADFLVTSGRATAFTVQSLTALTADANTTGIEVMNLGAVDIQHVIDQTAIIATGEMNTTTLTIQYSNDNANWVDGLVLANANTADATSITRVPVFGRWLRVKQDLTVANPITITLTAIGR